MNYSNHRHWGKWGDTMDEGLSCAMEQGQTWQPSKLSSKCLVT